MGGLGPTEIILIILVIVLLFGAKKLPELARGSGRALRIFKSETKGLMDDDETGTDAHGRALPPGTREATTGVPETREVVDPSTPDTRQS
ncbi:MAG: Sec-independent protein translocase subunit TatA [Nocardioidaceae bacterium]|nr:Sec-independent protein translocase subunit TatA [Nocardioidaceae bacterium]MDQ3166306.1 Sec-independent protein translocase subunit TatA [Actinomycetota bacterium]